MATDNLQKQYTVTFGGWYQRTTLHLSEIYAFMTEGTSKLELSHHKLEQYKQFLHITSVSREVGYFEYIKATTSSGIEIRYYEDGLYILEMRNEDIKRSASILKEYFDSAFNPAISYLFSLGAPTPKVLANIKIDHPIVVGVQSAKPDQFMIDTEKFGNEYSAIKSDHISVIKTHAFIFVVADKTVTDNVRDLVEMQIFFREFKDQLEKYLNIHRTIWEEISEIKEKQFIKGAEVEEMRVKLDEYQKTISLINNRINQMSSYARTRSSIAQKTKVEEHLGVLFQYKFEVLLDTLEYIKQIWSMTTDYVNQAISVILEIKGRALNADVTSLRTITTIGVITGIIGFMTMTKFPQLTSFGVFYFLILLVMTAIINFIINQVYKQRIYKLKFTEHNVKL